MKVWIRSYIPEDSEYQLVGSDLVRKLSQKPWVSPSGQADGKKSYQIVTVVHPKRAGIGVLERKGE